MPYQNNLKNKYSHYLRNDQIILYLSSHIGIFEDKKNIKILTKHNHNKKVYVIIHPREKKDFWIKKFKMEKKVKIFPNPSNGKLSVISSDFIKEMTIYTIMGEKIKSIDIQNSSVADFEINTKGFFLIKIQSGNTYNYEKVIIE